MIKLQRLLPSFFLLVPLVLVLLATSVHAQSRFAVNGRVKIEGSDLIGARAVVYKEGVKERTISTSLSKFSLDLELNTNYIISFEKDGFVTKKLSFNTRVPADASAQDFAPFEFSVSLFKQYDDMNTVVFNQPVGVIRYDRALGDFDYDTDYTKSIQAQLQQAITDVEKLQKEEAQRTASESKRLAAEEKARAKEEAEARKQAQAEAQAQRMREEAERKLKAESSTPMPEPPPPPPPPVTPSPVAPVREKPLVQRTHLAALPVEGQDDRRSLNPVIGQDARPVESVHEVQTFRHEELVIEPAKVTTLIELETDGVRTQYKRVVHKWGEIFYFKNEQSISRTVYEQEALGDRVVDAAGGSRR